MKTIIKYILTTLFAACAGSAAFAQGAPKTVAIFVRNDSPQYAELLNANKKNLENILAAHINGSGFGIISPDLVLRNINAYLGDDNAKYKNEAEKLKSALSTGKKPDLELFENASGLRLAEMIGADYILTVSIAGVSEKVIKSSLYGVNTVNCVYTMRCNYSLYEGGMAVGTAGASVKSQKNIRLTTDMTVEKDEDFFNELLEDCALQMADSLKSSLANNKIIAKADSGADIIIEVKVTAMRFPQVFQEADGSYAIEESVVPLELMTINADIDGVSHTTNNGVIRLSKGIHYLKIHHKDLEPIEKTINVTGVKGQKFVYEGILTEGAKKRLQADMEWMQKTVERYKDSINRDKIRDIDLERRRILAKGEASDVEIKLKKAEVQISKMQSDIEIEKNMSQAEVARIKSKTAIESKVADARVREIDANSANRTAIADARAKEISADSESRKTIADARAKAIESESKAKIILSEAEMERAKGIYEALKNSGFKINANVKY